MPLSADGRREPIKQMKSGWRLGEQCLRLKNEAALGPASLIGILISYVALWLMLTPYAGLRHDAQAYAFQAMARLDTSTFGQDVFLQFASQDRYTIFPAVYGLFISLFGLETSSAALTFVFHVLWFTSAFLLARRLFGVPLALLCLGLLITIPGPYGGQRVFHIAEPFLTARLPAEVISLLAMWAFLAGRRLVAVGLLALALVVHPLMAFPALILISLLWLQDSRPRTGTMPLGAVLLFVGAILGSVILGGGLATMDPDWLATARTRSGFLFPGSWYPADWNHTLTSLLTLSLASLALPAGPARTLARGALWLGLTGLALAIFAAEVWNLKLLLQGQPWRWLWLARFTAILLLPAVLSAVWSYGAAGRAATMLLIAAWIVVLPMSAKSPALVMIGSLLAAASLATWSARARLPESTQLLLQSGAAAVLAMVVIAVVVAISLVKSTATADSGLSVWAHRLQSILDLITPAIVIAIGSWFCWCARNDLSLRILALTASVALLIVAIPPATQRWMSRPFGERYVAAFADWRMQIPRDTEVFWWDGLREVWFLLQRRSYLTLSQGGGVVFSSETSRELRRRAQNVSPFIDPGYWFNEQGAIQARPHTLTPKVLTQVCKDPILGFVVASDDLATGAPRKEWPAPGKYIYLYDCAEFRASRSS